MESLINKISRLPQADKDRLILCSAQSYDIGQSCLPTLSIFNNEVERSSFENYTYEKLNDRDIYYIGNYHQTDLSIFVDENKKILFYSRYYNTHLAQFVHIIDDVLSRIENVDLSQALDIGENYVSIEKWFITYGHFKDEAYSLGDFLHRNPNVAGYKALLDYPTDSRLDTDSFKHNANYAKIDKLIFGEMSINAFGMKDKVLKLKNLTLIGNSITSKTFHAFPSGVSAEVRKNIDMRGLASAEAYADPQRVFITRSDSYRDTANKKETEKALEDIGFLIINPELITYEDLVIIVRSASTVVVFYGSALTNLIYLKRGARVIILKAESYLHESISLWDKVIAGYGLNVSEMLAVENNIDNSELLKLCDSSQ